MGLERSVSDDKYAGFFEEGSRLNRSYVLDADKKRRLLIGTFPKSCAKVYDMRDYHVGIMFNGFMDTARGIAYRNIRGGKLAYLVTVALMPFPGSKKGKGPTSAQIRKRLADLKRLSYPVKKDAGKMRKNEAEKYLNLVIRNLRERIAEEYPEALQEIEAKIKGYEKSRLR